MKIGDVEYQGDGTKAIFYYIADERVDFRQLIKVLADTFRVRIEMKQIGVRQEAGRIGGIGPCGRELCCSGWMTKFASVSTNAARYQDISPNPQKLAGQCGKIKCCMNYEADAYIDALKDFPPREIPLETADGVYYHFKTDVFKRIIQYSTSRDFAANLATITPERAKEIIAMNKKGSKPEALEVKTDKNDAPQQIDYENVVGQDSLTRFDKQMSKSKKQRRDNKKQKQPKTVK
jgi:cell fate regulator YaaT (PSP1 superfamily)